MFNKITIKTLLITGLGVIATSPALAGGTLNDYVAKTSENVVDFPNVIAFIFYLGGFLLAALGVNNLRQNVENPNNVPLKNALAKLGFGGVFMALPPLVSAVQGTVGGDVAMSHEFGANVPEDTLGGLMNRTVANTVLIPELVSFFGYMLGFLLIAEGAYKMKNHVEMGPQNVPLSDPLKFMFTGGAVMSLPLLYGVASQTFGDQQGAQNIKTELEAPTGEPLQLDNMMLSVMENAYEPVVELLRFFCFAAGAVLLLVALHRFTKTAQQGPQGPTGLGTIATFVLAGALFSIAPMIGMFTETLFGGRDSYTEVSFLSLKGDEAAKVHAENVTRAILAFLIVVGILSIIRGLFVFRGVAEGNQQMTMMSGISHVVAGAILVNFGQFANIIQTTLGIDAFGVNFK